MRFFLKWGRRLIFGWRESELEDLFRDLPGPYKTMAFRMARRTPLEQFVPKEEWPEDRL